MHYWEGKLELQCNGSAKRNSSRQWCLAEATLHGGRFTSYVKANLAGWNVTMGGDKALCPECSGWRPFLVLDDALNSEGVRP